MNGISEILHYNHSGATDAIIRETRNKILSLTHTRNSAAAMGVVVGCDDDDDGSGGVVCTRASWISSLIFHILFCDIPEGTTGLLDVAGLV